MIRITSYALLTVLLLVCRNVSAQSVIDDTIHARLEQGVKGFRERYHAPSVVLMIVHRDQVIYSGASGYTDMENKLPATVDAKYQIQSITKMFTATLAMHLWERGIIGLHDDIKTYVPEFSAGGITLMELATHMSGLPRNSAADIGFAKQADAWMLTGKSRGPIAGATTEEFLRSLGSVVREHSAYEILPQDTRHYSNMGFALLGLALGKAANTGFEESLLNRVCRPLNLDNTGFGTVSKGDIVIARGYSYRESDQTFVKTPDFYANAMAPASGMYSTAKDLATFISAQFKEDNGVLSSKGVRMMQALGIGWQRSYPFVKHEGAMLGSRSEIVVHPGLEVGWVILTNTTDFEFSRFNEYIAGLILPLFAEPPVTDTDQYTGTYMLEGGKESIRIYSENGKLYSTYLEDILPRHSLSVAGNHALKYKGPNGRDISYMFLTDGRSKIVALKLSQLVWTKRESPQQ
ncbi:serine hydrolase domain-containing protein [Chitinophaga lutea]